MGESHTWPQLPEAEALQVQLNIHSQSPPSQPGPQFWPWWLGCSPAGRRHRPCPPTHIETRLQKTLNMLWVWCLIQELASCEGGYFRVRRHSPLWHQPISPYLCPGLLSPLSRQTGEPEEFAGLCTPGLPGWKLEALQAFSWACRQLFACFTGFNQLHCKQN